MRPQPAAARPPAPEGWDARRLLLGDWSRLVRDPIDLLRVTFLVGAVAFAIEGEAGKTANLVVAGIAVIAARLIELPRPYDLSFVLAMYLVGWGEVLGLYDAIDWYDNLVHTLAPMLTAPVAYIALARADVLLDLRAETHGRHYIGIFVTTLALGLAIGAVWEMIEYGSDEWLGTNLSMGNRDTVGDLAFDGAGAALGAALLVVWARFSWGTVRRVPGDHLAQHR